jgi:uncharacterized protein
MDSETQASDHQIASTNAEPSQTGPSFTPTPTPPRTHHPLFLGPPGLRAGWSTALFLLIFLLLGAGVSQGVRFFEKQILHHPDLAESSVITPDAAILSEGLTVLVLLIAASIMARIERRRILDYNLTGPGRISRFLSGLVTGFAALSLLVGMLYLGGWIHFGPVALTGVQIAQYAALWAVGFLFVGLVEEGLCRCYLQFTLGRGINFWWALGAQVLMCASLLPGKTGQAAYGVYLCALLGVIPCYWLQKIKSPSNGFWQAAWLISTFFGFIHTSNNGETWVGIFQAAAIGFIFAASVRITGSAWWAIGCHAAWDWAESYFYGTADSGYAAKGHLLTTTSSGPAFWSGGTDGPEGSVLGLGALLFILAVLLVQYRSKRTVVQPS